MKVSRYLGFDLIKIQYFLCLMCLMCQCFNVSYKQDSAPRFLFPPSAFCIRWYYCIIFHRDHRDLLLYGFLKWKMTQENGFMAISWSFLCPKKIVGRIYTYFLVFLGWITWLIEGLLRLHLTECVKQGKKLEFPTLLLVKSCLPPVDTSKQLSNE